MKKEKAMEAAKFLINKLPKDKETLEKVANFFSFFSQLYKREKEVKSFILNPLIGNDLKVNYIKALADRFNLPKEATDVLSKLVELNLLPLINEIERAFQREMEKVLSFSKGFLIVAAPIDGSLLEKVKEKVSKILGREVSLEVQEDPSIIGGFVVKMPSFVIDASVKRSLERLGG